MDNGNWRPMQVSGGAVGDSSLENGDWRSQLQADSRQRIVNKIMDTLKRHLPFSGHEGLQELKKIAERFEEKIYTAATSQSDYLRKISLKMLTMETRSQNSMPDGMQSNSAGNSINPSDPGSQLMPQVNNQGQQLPIPVPSNLNQSGQQQMMSQNIHNNMNSAGIQGSSSLSSGSGLPQSTLSNVPGQNSNLQNMQNMSGLQQVTVGNTMGSNNFANQRQMPGGQQLAPQQQQQQQQQQSQNSQYLYQQQLHQLAKQKLQQSNITPPMQSHIQQQQNLLQPGHMQSSQQSNMQPSMMQTVQNQQSAVPQSSQPLMNHQQSVLRQQRQPQVQPTQQQQQTQPNTMGQQQTNTTNMQQSPLIGQQNSYSDMQQQQQQQRLIGQQNKLSGIQQPQQHMIGQQNNLSSMQQQHLISQSNASGQQQQQPMLGSQSGNSSMLTGQQSGQHMPQSKMPIQQQNQQNSATLLSTQVQQSQPQLQQQAMPHIQSQQAGMQQQTNLLPNMQQRLPTSGGFQQQNMIDQQKQLFQQQRPMPEVSSTSLDSTAQTVNPNGGDWQEEVYQKIKAMKELYLMDLNDMYQKILGKFQQNETLPQQPKNEQLEKLKVFKNMLERFMQFLQIPKHGIQANYKDKLATYEKQIVSVINSNRRKPAPTQQPPQALPPQHLHSGQQSQQTLSQLTQAQSHDNQMNVQGSMAAMQPNNVGSLQQSSGPSMSGGSNGQQNIMNSIQPSSNLDPGQNSSMNSLLQVSSGSLQQNPMSRSGPQQVNINPMSLQSNSNILQSQHIKQQEQLLQNQQLKQFQNRQMQQQFLHKQQLMQQQQQQQFQQQTKQQQTGQLQGNQVAQLHQINDGGDIKLRQQMGAKAGAFQQQQAATSAQRSAYHQQMKLGSPFSPQLLSAASPQLSQHASPQIDQSTMFKSANSPFTVPSPSTSSASPLPGDFGGVSSLSNIGNIGHQQPSGVLPAQSLAIGTPGISASPLLAEFTSPDGNHGGVPSIGSGRSSVTEQPLERLLKVVKSISPQALSASVSDIGSVVSMIDRIAGSAPGNGSRAAVGEDLVAMTKCRLQARNFVTQDGTNGMRKMKRFTSAMPLNVVSSAGSVNDSYKQLNNADTSELDSTASSAIKKPRVEANHALLEEIKEINRGLIDTVVGLSEEDADPTAASAASEGGDGTIVKCSFSAVALGPNLKSQYASAQMSPIQPLRLLVPANYPNCSPILLDKFPAEVSKEFEDLSLKTKSRFSISLRSLSQPMSLKDIAKTWDVCARAVISEYAQQTGGGTFSSKYGTWENCLSAA
ncbi:mediator of RNA polymerase II transcription subunit 15a-like isoform X2 [Rutidosis leptorrhynchoides]|uniref:mediator of RNA polymerase II transcription subunit 15a-like isoform X2 n=1 Tax=Rutidosis leptorrhynchoides TaxID=125765 RepID=UPI003A99B0CC